MNRPPVFVDRLRVHRSRTEPARTAGEQFGHRWCHLWSDDLDALHAMAAALGIRREWFQDRPGFPHYDLPPFRRERALILGAVEHSLKTWLRERRDLCLRLGLLDPSGTTAHGACVLSAGRGRQ